MKVFWILLFTSMVLAKMPPEFPEPGFYTSPTVLNKNDSRNVVFNGWQYIKPDGGGINLQHSNREWGYQWFVGSMSFITRYGTVGFGASHYVSQQLPEVAKTTNNLYYLASENSDAFSSGYFVYLPKYDRHRMAFIFSSKYRVLHSKKADALAIDMRASSKMILNHRIGLKTNNFLASKYKWSTGKKEVLPKHVGIYYIQPIYDIVSIFELNYCVNYEKESQVVGSVAYALDSFVHLFLTIRSGQTRNVISYGASLILASEFSLDYSISEESTPLSNDSFHSVGIGLLF